MIEKKSKPDEPVIIDNFSSFNSWRHELRTFRITDSSETYRINLRELSAAENQQVSDLIKTYNNECGCKTGSFFMSLVFTITVISYFLTGGRFSLIEFKHILWLVGITLIAALTGKLVGLLQARWKLIKLSNEINARVRNVKSNFYFK